MNFYRLSTPLLMALFFLLGNVGNLSQGLAQVNTCPLPVVQLQQVQCTSAVATWAPVAGVRQYNILYRKASETTGTNTNVTLPTVMMTSLTPGTEYVLEVAYQCSGRRVFAPVRFRTPLCETPTQCAPLALRPERVTCNSAVVMWPAIPGISSYQIVYQAGNDTTSIQTRTVPAPPAVLQGLTPNTQYLVRVSYNCNGRRIEASLPLRTPTCDSIPACTPVNLRTEIVNCSTAVALWQPLPGVNQYGVTVRQGNTPGNTQTVRTSPAQLNGLAPGSTYTVEVSYICDGNPVISRREITTPVCDTVLPCLPLQARFDQVTCKNALLMWNPIPGINQYVVNYRVAGTNGTTLTVPAPPVALQDLTANTEYAVEISYLCNGRPTTTRLSLRTPACDSTINCLPLQARPAEITCRSAMILWGAIPGINQYTVTYRSSANTPGTTINVPAPPAQLQGLAPATEYQVEVSYLCNNRKIATTINFRTTVCDTNPTTCPPMAPRVERVTCDRAVIMWPPIPGVTGGYNLVFSAIGDLVPRTMTVPGSPATLEQLRPEAEYNVSINYVCNGTRQSATLTFKTGVCDSVRICNPVTPNIVELGCNRAVINWPSMPGVNSYIVTHRMANATTGMTQTVPQGPANLQNLRPGTEYIVEVGYICNNQRIMNSISFRTTLCDTTRPCPPVLPRVESVTCNSAKIGWDLISSASSYRVSFRSANDSLPRILEARTSPAVLERLQGSTEYFVEVAYMCNGAMVVGRVSFRTANCDTIPCDGVRARIENITCKNANVVWENIPGINGYTITYRAANANNPTTLTPNQSPAVLENLTSNTEYVVEVVYLCNNRRIVTPLNFRTAACDTAPDCRPLDLRLDRVTCNTGIVVWTPRNSITEYTVSYRKTNENVGTVINVPDSPVTLANLDQNTPYVVEITFNCGTQRVVSRIDFRTLLCDSAACPQLVFGQPRVTCNMVTLTWQPVPNVTAYTVTYQKSGTAAGTTLTVNNPGVTFQAEASSRYIVRVTYVCNNQTITSAYELGTPACRFDGTVSTTAPLTVYPNPTRSVLNLEYTAQSTANVELLDLTGRVALRQTLGATAGAQTISLNVETLPAGYYKLVVREAGQIRTTTVVIE